MTAHGQLARLRVLLLLLVLSRHLCSGEHIYCSVVEEQPRGTPVCSLPALMSPAGSQVPATPSAASRYQLIERDPPSPAAGLFELHPKSGLLSLAAAIDREAIRACRDRRDILCRLDLAATYLPDPADPSGMRLLDITVGVEDINDNAPRFVSGATVLPAAIREHDRSARIPLPRAEDPDAGRNGTVTYSFPEALRYTGWYAKFVVSEGDGPSGGLGSGSELRVVGDIDLEGDERDVERIELTVQACDDGWPKLSANLTVRVTVENVNDFDPVFEAGGRSTSVMIPENATVNSVVLTARATDRDEPTGSASRLTYSLRRGGGGGNGIGSSDAPPPFRIDSRSGEVRLISSLNAEERQAYSLEVLASDGHWPEPRTATMTVSVRVEDVNDNAPEILVSPVSAEHGLSVQENQPSVMLAIVDVVDRDVDERNRRLDCNIVDFNRGQDAFVLLSDAFYGSGGGSGVGVGGGGGSIGRLEDPGRRRYILKNSRPLDREQTPEYSLRLTCHDSAGLSTVRQFRILVRDVNDSPPRFLTSHRRLRVAENRPPGTVVGSVLAQDADEGENARTVYQSESCYPYLGIGPHNGTLYTLISFDREVNSSFACSVTAHDVQRPELTAAIGIRVDIDDENDCSPVFLRSESGNFTMPVKENSRPGLVIGRVVARDDDEGENGRVTYDFARPNGLFRVMKDGGIQLIAAAGQLDRETSGSYQLLVRAMDNGRPQRRTDVVVTVQVVDENDNAPRFLFPSSRNSTLNVSVYEGPGAVLAVISAEDADSGDNGLLNYSLLADGGGDVNGGLPYCDGDLFRLNSNTGLLVLTRSLPLNLADRFACRLMVAAADTGAVAAGRRRSQQSLTVRFTGDRPRDDSRSVKVPLGDGSRGGRVDGGGSGARDLVVVTVCVALSFLVLLCVVLLLAYFCYYLQLPGQAGQSGEAAAAAASATTMDGMATPGFGLSLTGRRKIRLGCLEKLGFRSSSTSSSNTGAQRNGANAESASAPARGRNFISLPVQRSEGLLKATAICEEDDEFVSSGPQYFATSRQPAKQSVYYQRPQSCLRYNLNQRRCSDDSDASSAFVLPHYTSAAGAAAAEEDENGADEVRNTTRSSFARSGLGRLNSLNVDAKKSTLSESYYKSLRPPSTDPTRRRWQPQQQQQLLLEELPATGPKFQTVRYLVDPSCAGGRTAEAGRGGFVYGSPYLTSSFV